MKKTVVAFDIGESYLKIAQQTKNGISVHTVQMPENLIKDCSIGGSGQNCSVSVELTYFECK